MSQFLRMVPAFRASPGLLLFKPRVESHQLVLPGRVKGNEGGWLPMTREKCGASTVLWRKMPHSFKAFCSSSLFCCVPLHRSPASQRSWHIASIKDSPQHPLFPPQEDPTTLQNAVSGTSHTQSPAIGLQVITKAAASAPCPGLCTSHPKGKVSAQDAKVKLLV